MEEDESEETIYDENEAEEDDDQVDVEEVEEEEDEDDEEIEDKEFIVEHRTLATIDQEVEGPNKVLKKEI